nr:MFS transporter [Ktedonosporobacter rubrisoli]
MLPENQRGQAAAREQTTSNLLKIIGPFLGAPLIFAFGIQWAILINALSFLISWGLIFQVRTPMLEKTASKNAAVKNFWGEMQEGLVFYKESRIMLTVLFRSSFLCLALVASMPS